ncbi:MAG: hypothetical protein GKR96_13380 [Gammaproteobacteria bacterium]|nr:hypothetical protein [Gammaproteobacteria bacterium]
MNAIHDSYQPGLNAFKAPFLTTLFVLQVSGIIGFLAVLFFKSTGRYFPSFIGTCGFSLIVVALLTLALAGAPCLKPHPRMGMHKDHHNLKMVVERSLLCPRYSNRSYPRIAITGALGMGMFIVGGWRSRKNRQPDTTE